jgi:hypothetical protein
MVIFLFCLTKILNKNKFLLEKNNSSLLYFLIEIEFYFFLLKILQIFLKEKNKIQIDKNYTYLFNRYINNKNIIDLSVFNIPYIKGVNSVYQNPDNIFKILNQIQVDILSMCTLNDQIIDSLLAISKDFDEKFIPLLNDLSLGNSYKMTSIIYNFEKLGYPVFSELTNPTIIKAILKYQLNLGDLSTLILDFFPNKISTNFDFGILISDEKYNIFYNYCFTITEFYMFLKNQNFKIENSINFLNTNVLTPDNINFITNFLDLTLTKEPEINSAESQQVLDSFLLNNSLNSKNDSISSTKLKNYFNTEKKLLFQNKPKLKDLYNNLDHIFLNNTLRDNTNTIKDILIQTKDLTINFNKLDRSVMDLVNAAFFNKKVLNRINKARNLQELTKKIILKNLIFKIKKK